MTDPVGIGVVGGNNRGRAFDAFWVPLSAKVRPVALSDPDPGVRARWADRHPGLHGYADLDDLLADAEVDAVYIASPVNLHARQAVRALRAGKHVLLEVPAAVTLDECWDLVETVEATGLTFMMAENYLYARPVRAVGRAVAAGTFGELTSGEGGYVHDLRVLMTDEAGTLTWRGAMMRDQAAASYPTHALAPVHHWLRSARTPSDYAGLVAAGTGVSALPRHIRQRFGDAHPGARPGYWRHPDSVICLLWTADRFLTQLRVDMVSARPYDTMHAALQGTTGCYVSGRHVGEPDLYWADPAAGPSGPEDWRPVSDLEAGDPDPRWTGHPAEDQAEVALWDRFLLEDFHAAVTTGAPPPVDVYAAANLSAVIPLSAASLVDSRPVAFPDFRSGRR